MNYLHQGPPGSSDMEPRFEYISNITLDIPAYYFITHLVEMTAKAPSEIERPSCMLLLLLPHIAATP